MGRLFSQVHGETNSDPRKPSKKDRLGSVCMYSTGAKAKQTNWPAWLNQRTSSPERDPASQTKTVMEERYLLITSDLYTACTCTDTNTHTSKNTYHTLTDTQNQLSGKNKT